MSEPITADGLRAWARGIYPSEAAVELLLAACHGRFAKPSDFVRPGDQPESWWIDLDALADWVSDNPWSSGERKVVSVAASLLGAAEVKLGDVLSGLDPDIFELVQQSFAHAHGRRPPSAGTSQHTSAADTLVDASLAITDLSRPLVDACTGLGHATNAVRAAADAVDLEHPEAAHHLRAAAARTGGFLARTEDLTRQVTAARSALRDLICQVEDGAPSATVKPEVRAVLRDVRGVAADLAGLDPTEVLGCQQHAAADIEARPAGGLDGVLAAVAGLQRRTVALHRAGVDAARGLGGVEHRLTPLLAPVPAQRAASAALAGQERRGPRR